MARKPKKTKRDRQLEQQLGEAFEQYVLAVFEFHRGREAAAREYIRQGFDSQARAIIRRCITDPLRKAIEVDLQAMREPKPQVKA